MSDFEWKHEHAYWVILQWDKGNVPHPAIVVATVMSVDGFGSAIVRCAPEMEGDTTLDVFNPSYEASTRYQRVKPEKFASLRVIQDLGPIFDRDGEQVSQAREEFFSDLKA